MKSRFKASQKCIARASASSKRNSWPTFQTKQKKKRTTRKFNFATSTNLDILVWSNSKMRKGWGKYSTTNARAPFWSKLWTFFKPCWPKWGKGNKEKNFKTKEALCFFSSEVQPFLLCSDKLHPNYGSNDFIDFVQKVENENIGFHC